MRLRHPLVAAIAACLVAASGCQGPVGPAGVGPTKKPAATAKPKPAATGTGALGLDGLARVTVAATLPAATLTGKVKLLAPAALVSNNGGGLISDKGGQIISDNGAGLIAGAKGQIISDNGAGILSNNSGGIISDNGAGIISDNGAGLTGKAKYGLAQAPAPVAGFALADATITFHDATGAVLVDAKDQPLTATSDKAGNYSFSGPLPPGNLVAQVKLNPAIASGHLRAMVARDGAGSLTLDLDLASTIGAAYVLGNFVKGQQPVFDKLPRAANEKLRRDLDVVRGYLTGAFAYDPALLVEAADALRTKEQAVDATIDEVKALLLGQLAIGAGRKATEVPLIEPMGMVPARDGRLLIAENFAGRIRAVGADGTLETLMDANFGTVKKNFLQLRDMAEGPDGALFMVSERIPQVYRLTRAGDFAPFAGSGTAGRGAVGAPLATDMVPSCVAVGPDGSLYIGEHHGPRPTAPIPPRVLRLAPDGTLAAMPQPGWPTGDVLAVATGPQETVYAYFQQTHLANSGEVWRLAPGAPTPLATGLAAGSSGDLAVRPDGTLVVSEQDAGRVVTLPAAGGAPSAIAGLEGLLAPSALALGPDGTLYVADYATTIVHALRPDGKLAAIAGTQAAIQDGDVTTFAINGPGGLAFDAEGRLLIAEAGSGTVKRFDGKALAIVAGTTYGLGGDGGPATKAKFSALGGIAFAKGQLWLTDTDNRRIRLVGADGNVSTVTGQAGGGKLFEAGQAYEAARADIESMTGIALAPDGTPYVASGGTHQVLRLVDGKVELVLGKDQGEDANSQQGMLNALLGGDEADPAKVLLRFPFGLAFDPQAPEPTLYMCDPGGLRIRKLTNLKPGTMPTLATHAGLSPTESLALAASAGDNPPSRNGMKAAATGLFLPMGLCFDPNGDMLVTEAGTRSLAAIGPLFGGAFAFDASGLPDAPARVLRISRATGTITTVCGPDGKWFTDPDAGDALVLPTSIGVAPDGRLVIVDTGANMVRILPAGSY